MWASPNKYETILLYGGGSVDIGRAVYCGGMTTGTAPMMARINAPGMPDKWFRIHQDRSWFKIREELLTGFLPWSMISDCYKGGYKAADAKLRAIGSLLSDNGCDCDCDHGYEDHEDDCTLCLACRIGEVLAETSHV